MTNPTLERAEQAAKREIDKLRKVRVPEYPGSWKAHEGLGWENLSEVVAATTRAVLMAVRSEVVAELGEECETDRVLSAILADGGE